MDLLHQRYASPFSFIDTLIENAAFNDYVEFLLPKVQAEKDDAMAWEFYLHKVFGKSFTDWKAEAEQRVNQSNTMSEAKKEEIITRSESILSGFSLPTQGGEE